MSHYARKYFNKEIVAFGLGGLEFDPNVRGQFYA